MKAQQNRRIVKLDEFRQGRDEMNLAELPLASISDRQTDGEKTVVFVDKVWDVQKKRWARRRLSVSGSDLYGLPTAKDDDVLLACLQLSTIGDFQQREVRFSRYELLKLLRWDDSTKNYRRLYESLRRWKGLTVYSDRAFYDHAQKSWVTRDFGIFDNLYIVEREQHDGSQRRQSSRFLWNEVLFKSFQSGYIKQLDWDFYLSLKTPVAKRLYRILDKRFYRRETVSFDLHELALNKVRVSRNYNTTQIKRAMMKGIRELETSWDLQEAPTEERFRKVGPGKWEAMFKRRRQRAKIKVIKTNHSRAVEELRARGVSRQVAQRLASEKPEAYLLEKCEFHDVRYKQGRIDDSAAWLVSACQDDYQLPAGFETSDARLEREQQVEQDRRKWEEKNVARQRKQQAKEEHRHDRVRTHLNSLTQPERRQLETEALDQAPRFLSDLSQSVERAHGDSIRRSIISNHVASILGL